jgi:branched-chain amino acid transport system substrate-binding protein
MRRFGFLGLVMLLGLFLGAMPASAAEEIRIGYIVPLSGSGASDGHAAVAGAKFAIDEINKAGGILGRNIKLFPEDDKTLPTEGVSAAMKLVERDKVHSVLKDVGSSVAFAVAEAIRSMQNPVPMMTIICTADKLTKVGNPWFFRGGNNSSMEAPAFVKHWVQNLGVKKVSFLGGNDEYGKSTVDECSKKLKELGGEVVSTQYFLLTDSDFYPILTKIRGERPDALMVGARSDQAAKISIQFFELGMNKMMKQFGVGGHSTADYIKLTGKEVAEGVQVIGKYDYNLPGARNEAFAKAFKAISGRFPGVVEQVGYDGIYIIAEAVKRAGGTDANKLREALEKTDYQGLVSRIAFDKNRQAHPDLFIFQYRDGIRQMVARVSTEDIDFAK